MRRRTVACWALLLAGCPVSVVSAPADGGVEARDDADDAPRRDALQDDATGPIDEDAAPPDARTPDDAAAAGDGGTEPPDASVPRDPLVWRPETLELGPRAGRAVGCFGARGVVVGDASGRLYARDTAGHWRELSWRAPRGVQAIDGWSGEPDYWVLTENAAYRFAHGVDQPRATIPLADYPQDLAAQPGARAYLVSNLATSGPPVPALDLLESDALFSVSPSLAVSAVGSLWVEPRAPVAFMVVVGRGAILEGTPSRLTAAAIAWPASWSVPEREAFDVLSVASSAGALFAVGSGVAARQSSGTWQLLRTEPNERLLAVAGVPGAEPEAYAGGRLGAAGSFVRIYRGGARAAGGDANTNIADLCFQSTDEAIAVGYTLDTTAGVVLRGAR